MPRNYTRLYPSASEQAQLLERRMPRTWIPGVLIKFAVGKERVPAAVFPTNRINEITDFRIDQPDGATVGESR